MRTAFLAVLLSCTSALSANSLPKDSDHYEEACFGPASQTTLAQAACEHLTGIRNNLAGDLAGAESHYRHALALWDQVTPRRDDLRTATLLSLADLLAARHHMDEAEKLLNEAKQIAPAKLNASVLSHFGAFYGRTTDPERGRPYLTEAIPLLQSDDLAYACNALGLIDLAAGHNAEAETELRKAVEVADTIDYQTNLGAVFYAEGKLHPAEVLLERARAFATGTKKAIILADLAAVKAALNKFGTAEDLAEQALDGLLKEYAPDSAEVVTMKISLGSIYLREHKTAEAEKILPEAVRMERALPLDPRVQAQGLLRLAELRTQQKQRKEAEALLREAALLTTTNHPTHA